MLQVAVIGLLANRKELQDSPDVPSKIQFILLESPPLERAQVDLIIALKSDDQAVEILYELIQKNSMMASIVSWWEEIPPTGELGAAIQKSLLDIYGFVVGYTEQMHIACRWIRSVSHQAALAFDLRTLIIGESGTGKELVAKAIHKLRLGEGRPFVAINCAALPEGLIDSELFGHTRGAFTGAHHGRAGALHEANGGVLFLDEIADLPLNLQVKLLRVLEERTFRPLGSDKVSVFSAQVVSATNRRLDEAVKQGSFRSDLYFRIAQLTILLPPLRERRGDISLLIRMFLDDLNVSEEIEQIVGQDVFSRMLAYEWPGNIRELKSTISRIILMWRSGHPISPYDWQLFPSLDAEIRSDGRKTLADLREDFDRKVLEDVLLKHDGNTELAAQELGITRRSIYNLAKRYGLTLGQYSDD